MYFLITFSDGSNPYICKTKKEFNRIQKKYNLTKISDTHYHATIQKIDLFSIE